MPTSDLKPTTTSRRTLRTDTHAKLGIAELFGILILLVIGLALFPTIQEATTDAQANATGATDALLGLMPLIFVIILIAGAAAYLTFRR